MRSRCARAARWARSSGPTCSPPSTDYRPSLLRVHSADRALAKRLVPAWLIVANSAIGIFLEVRAKRTLDRLAVLNAPRARRRADGSVTEVEVGDVVADDLLELRSGDQVLARRCRARVGRVGDRRVTADRESPIPSRRRPNDDVQSGIDRRGRPSRFQATAVGAEARTPRSSPRRHGGSSSAHSELRAGTNAPLRWISLIMLVVGPSPAVESIPDRGQRELAGRRHRHGRGPRRHGLRGLGAADEPSRSWSPR